MKPFVLGIIMAKVDMQNTEYFKSGRHLENIAKARMLANVKHTENAILRATLYLTQPNICKSCGKALAYQKRHNKFCSSSCSATFTNIGKEHSFESRLKRSEKLYGVKRVKKVPIISENIESKPKQPKKKFKNPDVVLVCKICKIEFSVDYSLRGRVTCGKKDCRTKASIGLRTYQNGSRKPTWYFNKHDHTNVLLESSWEVIIAEFLDKLNISWTRPKPISWNDEDNVARLYYPDFYLPVYDVYLDPKNPYCMVKDEYKLKVISEKVTLLYGSLKVVKSGITKLLNAPQPTH